MLTGELEAGADPGAILLLAVLQGLTEFLPVSSSGHLVLARDALEVGQGGLALDVALHLGTLGAVVVAYRAEVRRLFADLAGRRWHMWAWLILATVPAGVLGLALKDLFEEAAESPRVAAIGLFVTASLLVVAEWRRRPEPAPADDLPRGDYGRPRWSDALVMGVAQALAIVPGISRSGSTIAAGLLRGLSVRHAARLSFLMSLPAVSGAALVELPDAVAEGFSGLSLGLVVAAVLLSGFVGWGALRMLLLVTARGALRWFAGYCALLGGLALVFAG